MAGRLARLALAAPGNVREALALAGGWIFFGVTLSLIGGVRAYNVFLRDRY